MKRIIIFSSLIVAGGIIWYLFIRSYDFKVNFKLKTTPGTIRQVAKIWEDKEKSVELIKEKAIGSFVHQVSIEDHLYYYRWEIELINDSTSQVEVYVDEPAKSPFNRILVPFTNSAIEKHSAKKLRDFYDQATDHLKAFRVSVEGVSGYDRTFCVYIPLETDQRGKAFGMMGNFSLISEFILKNKLETNGVPFVEVTERDWQQDQIKYNFCYPIKKLDSLPTHSLLKYKWLDQSKAIKAIYNGNYITSDRAWYALENYARKEGYQIKGHPVEFFYNNPSLGGNELSWRAEIFLPIE